MSFSRFDVFSERGAAAIGEDATAALHDYLMTKTAGARLVPERVANATELDEDDLEQLIEIACDPAVGVLQDASQVYCPQCGTRIDVDDLRRQLDTDSEMSCPSCNHDIKDLHGLPIEQRYRLSDEAGAEAVAWQAARDTRPTMTAVVLTALPEELAAVRKQMIAAGVEPERRTVANGGMYYTAVIKARHVVWTIYATFTQASNSQAAAGAVEAILNFSPTVAIFVGIAGGIKKKDVALGDVVAATEVFDYDGGKEDPRLGSIPRPVQLHSSFALNQLAGFTVIEDTWRTRIVAVDGGLDLADPVAHAEPIAAGSKVVASTKSTTFKLVRATADRAVAVEMEGSGFLTATQRSRGIDSIVIRGASDLIDGKSAADKDGVRKQAVANAAAFAFEMLDHFDPGG
jgi:nucleoside phosphorylase/predicted RNA-binding Zn-ribbon protein involved in translation (DUF1610 family)